MQANKHHFGAFITSQLSAMDHRVNNRKLSYKDIKHWQKLITEEQANFGHRMDENEIGRIRGPHLQKNVRIGSHIPPSYEKVPMLLSYLIEDINATLARISINMNESDYCNSLSEFFLRFEKTHPFADGNNRVGRLLANYIATYCGKSLIIFKSEMTERNQYYKVHDSQELMRDFFWKKIASN